MKTNDIFRPILLLIIFLIFPGCQSKPDLEAMKTEILELHKKNTNAHLEKDVDYLVKNISKDFTSVTRGDIIKRTTEDMRTRFDYYLNRTNFTEYSDLQEPIIGISKDGSLAWSIARVKIAGQQKSDDGSMHDLNFTCAWLTLYERQGDQWIKLTEVDNFK